MKVVYWCPYFGNVGTINAVLNSAKSLLKDDSVSYAGLYRAYSEWEGYENKMEGVDIIDFKNDQFICGLPKYGIGFRFSMILISLMSLKKLIKHFNQEKPDIVIANLLCFLPLLARQLSKHKPIVFASIQGLPKFNLFRTVLWKLFYTKADYIICLSNETRDRVLIKFRLDPNKVVVVNNPVIGPHIEIMSREPVDYDIFQQSTNYKILIGVGRLTRQKGFETLILAVKNLIKRGRNVKLLILGEGESRKKLERLVIDNCLSNHVSMLGFVANPYKYIAKSDLFVLSSRWEDPGHVLIEAAYLNVPIVSTDCRSGPGEFLENGRLGAMCPVEDVDALANAIEMQLSNTNTIQEMVRNARSKTENYTFGYHSKLLLDLIKNSEKHN